MQVNVVNNQPLRAQRTRSLHRKRLYMVQDHPPLNAADVGTFATTLSLLHTQLADMEDDCLFSLHRMPAALRTTAPSGKLLCRRARSLHRVRRRLGVLVAFAECADFKESTLALPRMHRLALRLLHTITE